MTPDQVPNTFPFSAYYMYGDEIVKVKVLSYGLTPGASIKTFACRDTDGRRYRTSIDSFRLTRDEVEAELSAALSSWYEDMSKHIDTIKLAMVKIEAHPQFKKDCDLQSWG